MSWNLLLANDWEFWEIITHCFLEWVSMLEIYNEFDLHFYIHVTLYRFSGSDDQFCLSSNSVLSNLTRQNYNESLVLRLDKLIEHSLYLGLQGCLCVNIVLFYLTRCRPKHTLCVEVFFSGMVLAFTKLFASFVTRLSNLVPRGRDPFGQRRGSKGTPGDEVGDWEATRTSS